MWGWHIFGIEFYRIFYFFIIYSFCGWIWESTYVSLKNRKFVNRGFLNGPIIPIYGAGATVIYLVFYNPYLIHLVEHDSLKGYVLIFLIGMVAASVLEFVTSYVMEKLFHAKWWDYSDVPLNIQGRICVPVSLFWGALSVVLVKLLHPEVAKLVALIPRLPGEVAAYIILVFFLADLAVTVAATVQLDKKINAVQKLREEVYEYLYGLKLYEAKEELKGKLSSLRLDEFFERGKQWHLDELEAKAKGVLEKYKSIATVRFQRLIYRRIFTAFPNLRMNGREEALRDVKERLKAYKSRKHQQELEEKE
ncbi:MAG: putative ABC transporter permease [Lachnospiraceae bacterium]